MQKSNQAGEEVVEGDILAFTVFDVATAVRLE